jgi:sugar lactone lactonase YvrE
METLLEYSVYAGATYKVVANTDLTHPSGIALHEGRLFVTDNATGEIVAYDLDGIELGRIQTPASSLMGIEIGPDGRIWYVDAEMNQLVRLDPNHD